MKIVDLPKTEVLLDSSVFPVDGFADGTKGILTGALVKAILSRMDEETLFNALNLNGLDTTETLDGTDRFLVGRGNKKNAVLARDLVYAIADSMGKDLKRQIVRGKPLGGSLTDEQKAAIQDGSFKDLFLGDYWTIGDHTWMIVDFNYWNETGDLSNKGRVPHVVVMPTKELYTARMDSARDTVAKNYGQSEMRLQNLANAETIINSAFGTNFIYSHREYIQNSPSSYSQQSCTVEIPSISMMTGLYSGSVSTQKWNYVRGQFSLFRIMPSRINDFITTDMWLRDVALETASNGGYATIRPDGSLNLASSIDQRGVRPYFALAYPS